MQWDRSAPATQYGLTSAFPAGQVLSEQGVSEAGSCLWFWKTKEASQAFWFSLAPSSENTMEYSLWLFNLGFFVSYRRNLWVLLLLLQLFSLQRTAAVMCLSSIEMETLGCALQQLLREVGDGRGYLRLLLLAAHRWRCVSLQSWTSRAE